MNNNKEPRRRNNYPGQGKRNAGANNKTNNTRSFTSNKSMRVRRDGSPASAGADGHAAGPMAEHSASPGQIPSPKIRTGSRRAINPIEAARQRRDKKIISAAAVAMILIFAVAVALISRACGIRENTDDFIVFMSSKHIVPYNDTVRSGRVYINASAFSEFCGLTVSGSYDALKLSSPSGDYAVFTPDSASARINGSDISLPAPAVIEKGELWLPVEFISSSVSGVTVTVDREKNNITVKRSEADGSTPEKPVYVVITFSVSTGQTAGSDTILGMISSYVYKTDISKYSAYLSPADDKYLLLVNKGNPLSESHIPSGLEPINAAYIIYSNEIQIEKYAKNALEALMQEMRAAGFKDIYVSSGYRTYEKQSQLFNGYIADERSKNPALTLEQARQKVLGYSALPGTSEHQSGLCIDFISDKMTELDESFASHAVYAWLLDNAHKFGFVLRYPKEKTAVTGYNYEPWHYRFVGQYHAAAMKISGLCFEEYLGTLD